MFRGLERLTSHGLPAAEAIVEAEPTSRAAAHTSTTTHTCWPSLTQCRVPALVLRAAHVAILPLVAGTTTTCKTPRSYPHLTSDPDVTPFLAWEKPTVGVALGLLSRTVNSVFRSQQVESENPQIWTSTMESRHHHTLALEERLSSEQPPMGQIGLIAKALEFLGKNALPSHPHPR
jgi:hypothetical protein